MKTFKYQDKNKIRGAAAVELAIVIIVMLVMTAGIVEFGRAFWYYTALDKATRDAARYLSAVPEADMVDASKAAAAVTKAKGLVVAAVNDAGVRPAVGAGDVDVACDPDCAGSKPNNITVSISSPITLGGWFPFISGPSGGKYAGFNLSTHTTMRYMSYTKK
jgi:Flp pilus assembly protein TadG